MLETVFYSLGIVSMTVFLFIVIIIFTAIWYIKKHMQEMRKGIVGKIMGFVRGRNVEIASALGLTITHFIIDRIRKGAQKKRA